MDDSINRQKAQLTVLLPLKFLVLGVELKFIPDLKYQALTSECELENPLATIK